MNILFLHRNFPAQFKNLINELAKDSSNKICFITNNDEDEIANVRKIVYKVENQPQKGTGYLNYFEEAIMHGQAASACASALKKEGFTPDLIYAHSWGPSTFIKDIFPDVLLICYFEWFYNAQNTDFDFFIKEHSLEDKMKLRCKNANILLDLVSCDAGITPTEWQKSQFPKEFQNKITVIHDGIDTQICKPDENLQKGKILTYATRGMEAYRGFPEFMMAASILMKKYPDLQVYIAGEDKAFYGPNLPGTTYKTVLLDKLDFDKSRLHFTGKLPYEDYIKLLQSSTGHVYSTCPFVLSWSVLEAMACGCTVVASDTEPIKEVIKDGENGLLFDFFNVSQLVEKIDFLLNNPQEREKLSQNARKTILENYDLEKIIPKHLEFCANIMKK